MFCRINYTASVMSRLAFAPSPPRSEVYSKVDDGLSDASRQRRLRADAWDAGDIYRRPLEERPDADNVGLHARLTALPSQRVCIWWSLFRPCYGVLRTERSVMYRCPIYAVGDTMQRISLLLAAE